MAAGCADRSQPPPRFFAEGSEEVAERKLGFTTRNAIAVSAKEGWRQTVSVPPGASLDVALGMPCPDEERECSGVVRFQLAALRDNAPPELLLKRSFARVRLRNWQTARIDLSDLSGETIDLALTLEVEDPSSETPDENVAWWAEPLWVQRPERASYNVILISIDNLRADRLGCYGYHRNTSPELDGFAAVGVLFRQTISQAPWTTPSHMSLLTSLYPSSHGVNQGGDVFRNERARYRGLPSGVPTLAEVLRENGYRTQALTGGSTVSADLFFHGFDAFQNGYFYLTEWHWSRLNTVFDAIEDVPFFLFFHNFEVHAPYTRLGMAEKLLTGAEIEGLRDFVTAGDVTWKRLKEYLEEHGLYRKEITFALYDGGIRHADAFMGRLFEELKRRGLFDRTLIILTSDHGEEFGENRPQDFYGVHGTNLSEELIRVPLIFRMPGELQPGRVINDPVELVDVAPTILDLLHLRAPEGMQGRSLVPLMRGAGSQAADWTLSESTSQGPEMKALRGQRYKYVVAFEPDGGERSGLNGAVVSEKLFDLKEDPGENRTLHSEEQELLQSMRQRLVDIFETIPLRAADGERTGISEETLEQLRALGYID